MPEKVLRQICAGNSPIFEIVEKDKLSFKVTLRVVDEPSQQLDLPKSVLPILGKALMELGEKQSE